VNAEIICETPWSHYIALYNQIIKLLGLSAFQRRKAQKPQMRNPDVKLTTPKKPIAIGQIRASEYTMIFHEGDGGREGGREGNFEL